jgi:hypothetical protein
MRVYARRGVRGLANFRNVGDVFLRRLYGNRVSEWCGLVDKSLLDGADECEIEEVSLDIGNIGIITRR